jgi:hypothetical protein
MWDKSTPVIPTRAHVNPNTIIFNGYKVPISADGSPMPNKAHSFQFDDTWRKVGFMTMNTETRYNYGDGCCGAHTSILIDDNEGMRAHEEYNQLKTSGYEHNKEHYVYADVTPIYQENFNDVFEVYRKSSLHCDRFFLIEDYVGAKETHKITSRFLFRPTVATFENDVKICTDEGVTLYLKNLIGTDQITTKDIEYHPFKPDGRSQVVDFSCNGKEARRLFLAFISNSIQESEELKDIKVIGDPTGELQYEAAVKELEMSDCYVSMKLPAYMEADFLNYKTWWYQKTITKNKGKAYLKLPVGMWYPRLFINGIEIDLDKFEISKELIAPRVELPEEFDDLTELDVVLKVEVPIGHYDGGGDGTVGMTGGM